DILLWGYREAEHAVLGVSPYQMLYGHVGKGPLNTIKNCWTKEIDQQKEKKSVKDYMTDLKQDLEIGARVAEENCTVRQKKYIDKYNEKTQDKVFEIGESVRSEEHTSELQSRSDLVCRLLLEKKKNTKHKIFTES